MPGKYYLSLIKRLRKSNVRGMNAKIGGDIDMELRRKR